MPRVASLALASVLYNLNTEMTFTYVSGQGTDSTESSRTMWARVKGKTENVVLKLGFKQAFAFRPGMIIPMKGVAPSSKLYRVLINNLTWLLKVMKWISPKSVVNTVEVGKAMINISKFGYEKKVITPYDIQQLANQ